MRRKYVIGLAAGTASTLFIVALHSLVPAGRILLDTIEWRTYDWRVTRTAKPESVRTDIVLIEIDNSSLHSLESAAGRWPWPRVVHSALIDYLTRAPAKVIAYDVLFTEPDSRVGFAYGGGFTWSGRESDRALADSIRDHGHVLLLLDATYEPGPDAVPRPVGDSRYRLNNSIYYRPVIFAPFREASNAAVGFGHNLFVLDNDGPLRHVVPFVRSDRGAIPSLGVAAALAAEGIQPHEVWLDGNLLHIRDRTMELSLNSVDTSSGTDRYLWSLINFTTPAVSRDFARPAYKTYSFFDVMYSEEQLLAGERPNIDPSAFEGKIVFVGVTAAGLHDVFQTPFGRGRHSGIQIHATVADEILSNRFLHSIPDSLRVTTVAGIAIFVGVLSLVLPPWWATGSSLALLLAWIVTAVGCFERGYVANLSEPPLAGIVTLFASLTYNYFTEGREKRRIAHLFSRYVPKEVFDQLLSNPNLAGLGGQRRQMTVLFSDIRNFTTLSEKEEPEQVVALLNEYFSRMVGVVFKHSGTIDKFVGDMVMALFGAPLEDARHADHALNAALDMLEELRALNEKWARDGRPRIDIGIGINTGLMIAGNVGSESIMSYTVIGDAVNLGSRLESLNKQHDTHIIISDDTRRCLSQTYSMRALGGVVVKGKTTPVTIFEVTGRAAS